MRLSRSRQHADEKHKALCNERVIKNGRTVLRSRYNRADCLAEELGIYTSMKIARRFALWPTATVDGTIWLQTYWSFAKEERGRGLHAGFHWRTRFRCTDEESLRAEVTRYMTSLTSQQPTESDKMFYDLKVRVVNDIQELVGSITRDVQEINK